MIKCVSMAPFDKTDMPGVSYSDFRFPGVSKLFEDSKTPWVRFFVEWQYWFPNGMDRSFMPAQQAVTDWNIATAKSLGLKIILTTRSFPEYANGEPNDHFKFPDDVSATSAYGQWISYLMTRYHPSNRFSLDLTIKNRWIDCFEFVNEPNCECHPQSVAVQRTAEMFDSAYHLVSAINANLGSGLSLMGPATADIPNYAEFTHDLLKTLKKNGFNTGTDIVLWSHHNYSDVADGVHLHDSRTQTVRRLMKNHWRSRNIYLTEGGFHRPANRIDSARFDSIQATKLGISIRRLKMNRVGFPGEGVKMFTNFLFYSAPQWDSGLLRVRPDPAQAPVARPAYLIWKRA